MKLSFVETMRGSMRGEHGPSFPVSFELRALHDRGGRFEARGLLVARPLVDETSVRGTLDLGLRALTYRLVFAGPDGRRLTLDAVKHPSLRAPFRSMTRMPATIRDEDGRVVASGDMTFATRDLPAFLASWIPIETLAHRRLDARRRQIERRALAGEGLRVLVG
jgi:hypothetical protein